jgi:hypothetical protein
MPVAQKPAADAPPEEEDTAAAAVSALGAWVAAQAAPRHAPAAPGQAAGSDEDDMDADAEAAEFF